MNKKKIGTAIGGLAVATIAAVTLNSGGGAEKEIPYTIEQKNEYVTTLTVENTDDIQADIYTLYCNGLEVDTALVGKATVSIPLVFKDKECLEVEFEYRGKDAGKAKFEGDRLIYKGE